MSNPVLHNFQHSLNRSHSAEEMPFWEQVYKTAFPNMSAMVNHRQDGDHQRMGIDRSIILSNAKQITIDEKVRFKAYNDIALEYLSDKERNLPGWVCKPLQCDYIAYAIAPLGKCYLLPVIQLQMAWEAHKERWFSITDFRINAENWCPHTQRKWTTVSLGCPVKEVFQAIGNSLRIDFEPWGQV